MQQITIKDNFENLHSLMVNLILHYQLPFNSDTTPGMYEGDPATVIENVMGHSAEIVTSGFIHIGNFGIGWHIFNLPEWQIDSEEPFTNINDNDITRWTKQGRYLNVNSFRKNKLPSLNLNISKTYSEWININYE